MSEPTCDERIVELTFILRSFAKRWGAEIFKDAADIALRLEHAAASEREERHLSRRHEALLDMHPNLRDKENRFKIALGALNAE